MSEGISWEAPERLREAAAESPELAVGRVVSQEKDGYLVITESGETAALVSGRFRHEAAAASEYPAVGDYVLLAPNDGGRAVIRQVLPRKSIFLRKAAGRVRTEQAVVANVDTVFLCMSLNNDFNLRRMERYLSAAWESGATPVVVLTKADLCGDTGKRLAEVWGIAAGAEVLVTSSVERDGCRQILPYLTRGSTVAFVGSSGAGKSTMINLLLGGETLRTNGLRNDDKGRHTTTHRELLFLPDGAAVIDTPGMRELGMWDASEGIGAAFTDIEGLAGKCRFKNCTHTGEPDCAVRAALEDGSLEPGRLASYRKLITENAFAGDAEGYLSAKGKKFKTIAKENRKNKNKQDKQK